jgi:hypothetical protein
VRFEPGDEVVVVDGDFTGVTGTVLKYEAVFDTYFVQSSEVSATGHIACKESELDFLVQEGQGEDQVEVPRFPLSTEALRHHLEWMLGRALGQVGDVGPEQALFGFQQFEGKTPQEVLIELMSKLEEGMALIAQVHVMFGRIYVALEGMNDQD